MAHVKTAVSLPGTLFRRVDALARRMKVSRSRLFAIALEDFTHRQQNRDLLEKMNALYAKPAEPEEESQLEAMRRYQRRSL